MKTSFTRWFVVAAIIIFFSINSYSQTELKNIQNSKSWSTDNPFKTDVFVENSGQFDRWIKTNETIKYVINGQYKVFFTDRGFIIKLYKKDNTNKALKEKERSKEGNERLEHSYILNMNWENSNLAVKPEAEEQTEGYYTFGDKTNENIEAKGFRKLIYKNIYPNIDIVYSIPDKGGIKYKLILHPGADISKVRMHYSGKDVSVIKDEDGKIIIKTPVGNITDSAPLSFIEGSNEVVKSGFSVENNNVHFEILSQINFKQSLIIDPWLVIPNTLQEDGAAYDIAYDDQANVYVAGGTTTQPYYIAKYSANGSFIWTFTNPMDWSSDIYSYSKFCILPNTGTILMGEGFNDSGPRVMKIDKNGNLLKISNNFSPNNEIWMMFYNSCSGQLLAFGGGTNSDDNIYVIKDINLSSASIDNFNTCYDFGNDIASAIMDYNGDFFSLMASGQCPIANHLMKSLESSKYHPPVAFDITTDYDFQECTNMGIPGFNGDCNEGATVRANALALNMNYVFSYDGREIIAFNKKNGNVLGSKVVDASYYGGQYRTHEGIAVDQCNNVFVGGTKKVHVYNFNGNNFIPSAAITTNVPDEVYDLKIDEKSSILYISGLGFVSTYQLNTNCTVQELSVTKNVDKCSGKVSLKVNNGTPPYTFIWSNGASGSDVILPKGTYTVTISDNSCILLKNVETITIDPEMSLLINGNRNVCNGNCTNITASGAETYSWSPSAGINTTTGSNVIFCPSVTTTYTLTAQSKTGCTSSEDIIITVSNSQVKINISPEPAVICKGGSIELTASGGNNDYKWSPSGGLNKTSGSIVIASPIATTVYNISGSESNGCIYSGNIIVNVNQLPEAELYVQPKLVILPDAFVNFSAISSADFPPDSWYWTLGNGDTSTLQSFSYKYSDAGKYLITLLIENQFGCKNTLSGFVTVAEDFGIYLPNAFTPLNDINNVYFVYGTGVINFEMQIFDRWGKLLCESNDITKGWNGRFNGQLLPMAVYLVKIKYTDPYLKKHFVSGKVTLIR